ncbi:iron chelate uptake ABC transporter family permease subunit [Modestobacter sp. VKM Ac-2979]|uniref:FecCD family ABC transporter permease n=1 Tax=unclassified Modestobacter TaxID=2643866 RepID=UPI0022AB8BEB|nr:MULTISPECIES: iron chelate uptake ABC transporter family permease subunit [unclassified Modestobacter]MCZ2813128.1 iron chelate uptake ABC transporter family permease subunit [Modestobacter sp. VKM Ac-2979]MCZ2842843.1 iron chelate uptake ABC transporter family permease subunit [Modestobacter sp. VKM Ac-2980]
MTAVVTPAPSTVDTVARGRVRRAARRRLVITLLALAVLVAFVVTLMVGRTFYPPGDVLRVVLGSDVPGASFTVGTLRLPRAVLAVVAGLSFGLAGVTFQTMLRNPLASPDVIGITSGASAAAAFAIVILGWSGTAVSVTAIVSALGVALLIYTLAFKDGVAGTRLILIGIGVAAMGKSVTSYVLSKAGAWDFAEALRWLTGSLNGSTWEATVPALVALLVFGPVLLGQTRNLSALQLGDDTASALGVRVERTRVIAIVAAVALLAFATAACGPIAFVSFLAGPIAARLVGPNGSLLVPAALVGALLVLVADLCGQYAFGTRYPVGVITGVLGAPYLIYLIVRSNRTGGSL